MTSARANRDSVSRSHRVDPALLRPVFRAAQDGHGGSEVVPLGSEVQQQLVLRVLVEDFGGEVTGSALARHLSHQSSWVPSALGPRLIDVLQGLQRFGSLTLEENGESDVIVRLLPAAARPQV